MSDQPKPIVHVVFGMSAAGSLRQAIAQLGINQKVIGLPDDLSFGPIDPPLATIRAQWMKEALGYDEHGETAHFADFFWDQAIDDGITPVVWICRRSASEYAGFLEFLWRIGDQPFRIVDITNFEFVASRGRTGPQRWIVPTFGHVRDDEIINAQLVERQATLDKQQLEAYRGMWGLLREENAPFRIVTDRGLFSAPITQFDDVLASCVTGQWRNCTGVIHDAVFKLLDDQFDQCGDLVLWWRLRTLAEQGIFEMKGDGLSRRDIFVRLPLSGARL